MRRDQVIELIKHSEEKIKTIEKDYLAALDKQEIPNSLIIDIKNFMENLRSALDYMAHDIYEFAINPIIPKRKKIYFPYGKVENDFKSGVGSSLPDLENLNPDLFSIIKSIQPYETENDWLCDFCDILNQKKHESLKPQEKEVEKELHIDFPEGLKIVIPPGGSMSAKGPGGIIITRGSSPKMIVHNETVSPESPAKNVSGDVKQTIIEWTSFKFKDTDIVVMDLLRISLSEIGTLQGSIYEII